MLLGGLSKGLLMLVCGALLVLGLAKVFEYKAETQNSVHKTAYQVPSLPLPLKRISAPTGAGH